MMKDLIMSKAQTIYKEWTRLIVLGFFVSLVVEWQIPILLTRVRFPDEE